MNYQVVFQPEPEGGFTAMVPVLPGCVTWGASVDEARGHIREAIAAYLESAVAHGDPIPSGEDQLLGFVDVPTPLTTRSAG